MNPISLWLPTVCFVLLLLRPSQAIFGGSQVDVKQYPYTAVVTYNGSYACGASIIGARYILTTATCCYVYFDEDVAFMKVRLGNTDYNQGISANVTDMGINPFFFTRLYINSCILTLDKDLDFSDSVRAVPVLPWFTNVTVGQQVVLSGWGINSTNTTEMSDRINAITLPITAVMEYNLNAIDQDGKKGVCPGDLGGPAVVNGTLVGIIGGTTGSCGEVTRASNLVYIGYHYVRAHIRDVTGL
ncbi:trypsin 3A1-like [Cylas formicarius]|uniref:trypsin 3A1-like n=1 Tax=Cylas formicarius TaxID=197179 RepID=UPI00295837F4|nr:trypsin 3A1-like [Cylas formicarius]